MISGEHFSSEIEDQRFSQDNIFFAENALFDFFDWQLVKGNAATVFNHPYNIVLTEKIAAKYFGNENPINHKWQS